MLTQCRIAVLGTGANGATIAADLSRAGHDVVLIDQWAAHVEAMRARGVTHQRRFGAHIWGVAPGRIAGA